MTVGGAQAFVVDLANFAASCGADVHIVHLAPASASKWIAVHPAVGFHAVNGPDAARRVAISLAPDLIHQHYPATSWGVKGIEKKFPIVGTPHNWSQNIDPKLPDWAVPIAGPRVRIRHGVDLETFRPADPTKTGTPNGVGGPAQRVSPLSPLRVGIVGRMHKDKYPDSFLDALARWHPANVRLICAGRGLAADPIVERTARRLRARAFVEVLGDVPRADLPAFYRSLDVLLVPTVTESVCLAAIEAMACGVPVIGRAGSGLTDTVGDAAGVICATDDLMLQQIDCLAHHREALASMASFARHRAERHFDRTRMFHEYADLYRDRTGGHVDLLSKTGTPNVVGEPALRVSPLSAHQRPSVSVLMPVYRVEPDWFDAAVRSVMAQTGVSFELVIVLDGPDDRRIGQMAYDWALKPTNDPSVRIIVRPHSGIAAALNAGLRECRADLVARFDADDIMPAGRLAAQVAYFEKHPETDLLCGDMTGFDGTGRTWPMRRPAYDAAKPIYDTWMNGGWNICHPTVCYRRQRVIDIGGYDETLGLAEDLDLWCRVQRAGFVIAKTDAVWNEYRVHEGQQVARRNENLATTKRILDRYRSLDQRPKTDDQKPGVTP